MESRYIDTAEDQGMEEPFDAELAMQQMQKKGKGKKGKDGTSGAIKNQERLAERRRQLAERAPPQRPKLPCRFYMEGHCSKVPS